MLKYVLECHIFFLSDACNGRKNLRAQDNSLTFSSDKNITGGN